MICEFLFFLPPLKLNICSAIVTGSPDCSIVATDIETGTAIARLENSHGWVVKRKFLFPVMGLLLGLTVLL